MQFSPNQMPPGLAGYLAAEQQADQRDAGQLQQAQALMAIRNAAQQRAAQQQAQQRQAAYQAELANAPDEATKQSVMRKYLALTNPDRLVELESREQDRKLAAEDRRAAAEQRALQFAENMDLRRESLAQQRDLAIDRARDKAEQDRIRNEFKARELVLEEQNKQFQRWLAQQNLDIKKLLAEKEKPITEFQGKNALYGSRAATSDRTLSELEEKISLTGLAMKESAQNAPLIGGALGAAGNVLLSKDQQKVEQAQRDFVNAVLRQESGAVISQQEFDNAKKQYFPQPGDSTEVIAQKRRNRKLAIEGFKRIAGPAWASVEEQLKQSTIPAPAAPTPGRAPDPLGIR